MNKRDKIIDQLTEELAKANKANERLIEIAYRKEAQIARKNHDCKETERFRKRMRRLKFVDFKETAISIFGWEDLPEGNFNFFNSKRLETQINRYGKVCVFKHKYRFMGADGNEHVEEVFLCLPFTGVAGSLDCYGEFTVIKPYAPAGTLNVEYPELVVNKDCVIFTDFFEWSSTNGNVSLSVNDAIDLYASLIADCEAAKRINRNWIKIPFLFDFDPSTPNEEINGMISEIKRIVESVEDNDDAIVSKYAKNIQTVPTNNQYYGAEFTQCIKDYENELYNFLGIGHIRNENTARKIVAEFENTSDEYNINIIKRLQNRERPLAQAKKLWQSDFANTRIFVNLRGYAKNYDESAIEAESEQGERENVRDKQ